MSLHLTDFNEADRADYMVVVASIARAHGTVTSEDIFAIRELCMRFVLGPDARGRVLAAASAEPENLETIISRLAETPLKHSLLLDVCTMAWLDGQIRPEERAAIKHVATLLNIDDAQVAALLDLAHTISQVRTPEAISQSLDAAQKSGVPAGAVAVSATMMGLDQHSEAREVLEALKK